MQIEDVQKLAELAKIELTQEENEKLLSDMEGILSYVKQIQEVNVEEIVPAYEHKNIWREDKKEVRDFSHDLIVGQFPDEQNGFVKVKKIM